MHSLHYIDNCLVIRRLFVDIVENKKLSISLKSESTLAGPELAAYRKVQELRKWITTHIQLYQKNLYDSIQNDSEDLKIQIASFRTIIEVTSHIFIIFYFLSDGIFLIYGPSLSSENISTSNHRHLVHHSV